MSIAILAVTDEADPRIHSETLRDRFGHVAFAVSCGDLPASYLEFIADALNRPVYYVLGNHAEELTRRCAGKQACQPAGAVDLGGKVVRDPATGLILAGLPGSPKYCEDDAAQFSEWEIGLMAKKMAPRLYWNQIRHGRALDVLVTHAPPRDINDRPDPAHRGFETFRGFLEQWRPVYHLHGHVHLYDRGQPHEQTFADTRVINVFPYRLLELDAAPEIAERAVQATP